MDIHITTRHCQLNDEEHDAAIRAAEHREKCHPKIIRVDVIASEEKGLKEAAFTVPVQGHNIVAKETGDDHIKVLHDAGAKVERQLKKLNEKLHDVRASVAP